MVGRLALDQEASVRFVPGLPKRQRFGFESQGNVPIEKWAQSSLIGENTGLCDHGVVVTRQLAMLETRVQFSLVAPIGDAKVPVNLPDFKPGVRLTRP